VAEWPIAAVLKTAVGQPTVGSNPTSSAISLNHYKSKFRMQNAKVKKEERKDRSFFLSLLLHFAF
jgi:hypothetical protein